MPAVRERVYFCPPLDGHPCRVEPFPLWWDRPAFFAKFGERRIDTGNPIYVDYGILLTQGEALAWDERCRQALTGDPRQRPVHMAEQLHRWQQLLSGALWVIVESYEWESGLE